MISINRFPTQPTSASVGSTVGVAGVAGGGEGVKEGSVTCSIQSERRPSGKL